MRSVYRLKCRRVIPPDRISGSAVDQVLLLAGGPRELARYQHVLSVDGYVPHLRTRVAEAQSDVLV